MLLLLSEYHQCQDSISTSLDHAYFRLVNELNCHLFCQFRAALSDFKMSCSVYNEECHLGEDFRLSILKRSVIKSKSQYLADNYLDL